MGNCCSVSSQDTSSPVSLVVVQNNTTTPSDNTFSSNNNNNNDDDDDETLSAIQQKYYSNIEEAPRLIKSFSSSSSSSSASSSNYVWGFDISNRLLLAGVNVKPHYIFYDIETLQRVGSYDSKETAHSYGFCCLFLSDTVCAVCCSHQLEIFGFKREDPPKEKKDESIKISDCTLIKLLPLDQSAPINPREHTIISLNSAPMNNNNNNSMQLVLTSHRESCLSFWRTPNKNQLNNQNQYHQVSFLDLVKTYNFSAQFCRAKILTSYSSSSFCSSENSVHFVCTYLSGFCLFKVSWGENEHQKQEVSIELIRNIELSNSVGQYGYSSIDVSRNFVVAHSGYEHVGYLYDLDNFRVVAELKATTGKQNNFPVIKISEDADVVVLGTRSNNIHFFSQENNWKEVLFQQKEKPAIEFGNMVYDLHLCSDRQVMFAGGYQTSMKMFDVPILRNRWKRRRIVFLLQAFCGSRKTKEMLDMYRVRECLAFFL